MSVQKRISPWSIYEAAWGVEFRTLQSMYSLTRHQHGLVHAADDGPTLARNNYTVELGPVGLQRGDAKPVDELQAIAAAHGFPHGLQNLHAVSGFPVGRAQRRCPIGRICVLFQESAER